MGAVTEALVDVTSPVSSNELGLMASLKLNAILKGDSVALVGETDEIDGALLSMTKVSASDGRVVDKPVPPLFWISCDVDRPRLIVAFRLARSPPPTVTLYLFSDADSTATVVTVAVVPSTMKSPVETLLTASLKVTAHETVSALVGEELPDDRFMDEMTGGTTGVSSLVNTIQAILTSENGSLFRRLVITP